MLMRSTSQGLITGPQMKSICRSFSCRSSCFCQISRMDSTEPQFVGEPCGSHGPYTFYKAVRFQWNNKTHILALGDFFFLKILDNFPVCIGEIQLLWDEKNSENQLLASVRLYFKPKDSQVLVGPDKTEEPLDGFGNDELLVMSEKLILTVDDLIPRLLPASVEEGWDYGTPISDYHDVPLADGYIPEGNSELSQAFGNPSGMPPINFDEVEKEKKLYGMLGKKSDLTAPLLIMSYPVYSRYRAMMRRLEGSSDAFFNSILVMAIGGFTTLKAGMRVMFCRQEFEFTDLEDLEIHREDLAPNLKGRPRKRRLKKDDSDSNGYGSDQSSNASSTAPKVKSQRLQERLESRNGTHGILAPSAAVPPTSAENGSDEEKIFLKKLYKFMATKNSPIDRLPVLGCKKIDLYAFYKAAKELGGYKKICDNRMWKNLYDRLGGQTTNTSAATSTRRHYEKLILPYENFLRARERAQRNAGRAESSKDSQVSSDSKDSHKPVDAHVNGQINNKTSVTACEVVAPEETESDTAENSGVVAVATETQSVGTETDSVCTETQEKEETVKIEKKESEEEVKKTFTVTSIGTGTESPVKPTSPIKVFKVDDTVQKKPTFTQNLPTLEVPVYHQREAISVLSPLPHKQSHSQVYPFPYPVAQQAESPNHKAALPTIPSHHSNHKSPKHQLSQAGDHQRRHTTHHHHNHLNHHGHSINHHKSPCIAPLKTPVLAHNKALPVSQLVREQWQRFGLLLEVFDERYKDPHLLASRPGAEPLRDPPPPAHSRCTRYPTSIPDLPLNQVHLRRQRVHTDVHTSVDNMSFPHPDQVLSRIHTQAQLLSAAHQLSLSRPKTKTGSLSSPASSRSSSAAVTPQREVTMEALGSELFAGIPSFRDSSGKRPRPSPQPGPSSAVNGGASTSSTPLSALSSSSSLSSVIGAQGGSKSSAAQQAAEAFQQAQQQEVLLQSALFGTQFTALPRPTKPAEATSALPAFLPSMVHPHPAFVQALMSQGFPATPAGSALTVFTPQLSPTTQAHFLAYGEEMRQSMLAAASLPFIQLGTFASPAAKDSSSQQK